MLSKELLDSWGKWFIEDKLRMYRLLNSKGPLRIPKIKGVDYKR